MNQKQAIALIDSSLRVSAELSVTIARESSGVIFEAALLITRCLRNGGKVLFFGNGGSAADAQHLAAELVGRFVRERAGLAAIALTTDSSILTAVGNDFGFEQVFSRQIEALGHPNDVAIGISTSGTSANVLAGLKQASKQNLKTIGLTGKDGGAVAKCVDLSITVACANTARVQECHITIGHILCELVETELLDNSREV